MIVYGKQIFLYLLKKHPDMIEEVYLSKEIDKKLFNKVSTLGCEIKRVDTMKAQAMARGGNLILWNITDVGNIGAIVRSAYSLGVDGIVISGIGSINLEVVARTSAGALFDMPIVIQKDLLSFLNELKQLGFTVYGADMSGEDIRDIKVSSKKALLLGSEGEGLSGKVLKNCDKKVKIEMQREFDSLNVSVASAILCDRMRNGK